MERLLPINAQYRQARPDWGNIFDAIAKASNSTTYDMRPTIKKEFAHSINLFNEFKKTVRL